MRTIDANAVTELGVGKDVTAVPNGKGGSTAFIVGVQGGDVWLVSAELGSYFQ